MNLKSSLKTFSRIPDQFFPESHTAKLNGCSAEGKITPELERGTEATFDSPTEVCRTGSYDKKDEAGFST